MSDMFQLLDGTTDQARLLERLGDAAEEHFAFWNVGIDRAWEEGSEVLINSEVFSALLMLACKAPSADVEAFLKWVSA